MWLQIGASQPLPNMTYNHDMVGSVWVQIFNKKLEYKIGMSRNITWVFGNAELGGGDLVASSPIPEPTNYPL